MISFAGNRGKGHALLAGFAALADRDAVVTLDADGQHPPECLPDFERAAESLRNGVWRDVEFRQAHALAPA